MGVSSGQEESICHIRERKNWGEERGSMAASESREYIWGMWQDEDKENTGTISPGGAELREIPGRKGGENG